MDEGSSLKFHESSLSLKNTNYYIKKTKNIESFPVVCKENHYRFKQYNNDFALHCS